MPKVFESTTTHVIHVKILTHAKFLGAHSTQAKFYEPTPPTPPTPPTNPRTHAPTLFSRLNH